MEEAFEIGRASRVPVIVSHLKCAGIANWGRSGEVLQRIGCRARQQQSAGCDCYPYAAGSSTLDLRQVDRTRQDLDHLEHAPSRNGRAISGANRCHLGLVAIRGRAETAACGRDLSQHLRRRHAPDPRASGHDDWLRRAAKRSAAASSPLGNLPACARPLQSRRKALLALGSAIHKMTGMPAQRFRLAERGSSARFCCRPRPLRSREDHRHRHIC